MTIKSRLDFLERKQPPTAKTDALFADSPWFAEMVTSHGMEIDVLKQNGDILGALPVDLLRKMAEHLNKVSLRPGPFHCAHLPISNSRSILA